MSGSQASYRSVVPVGASAGRSVRVCRRACSGRSSYSTTTGPFRWAAAASGPCARRWSSTQAARSAFDTRAAAVWGEEPPRAAGHTLKNYVLRLRHALDPDLVIETVPGGYRCAPHRTPSMRPRWNGSPAVAINRGVGRLPVAERRLLAGSAYA